MSNHTAISFDADAIRVLKAQGKGQSLVVDHASALRQDELDGFLATDRSREYVLLVNTPDAIYETIQIPPVKPALVAPLVAAELQRLFPTLPPFVVAYRAIEDVVRDGKPVRRVACCLIPEEFLAMVLEPFLRHNRPIARIVTLPSSLAHLVAHSPHASLNTLLCAYDGGVRKSLFLLEKGCVTLVRQVPSEGSGWDEIDRQNVSMTLDYCFQTLRVRPEKNLALNGTEPSPPLAVFTPPEFQVAPEVIQSHLALIAALAFPPATTEDLRPAPYLVARQEQDILRGGGLLFGGASLVVALLLAVCFFSIDQIKQGLAPLRVNAQELQSTLESYRSVQQEREAVASRMESLAAVQAAPSLAGLMAAFTYPPTDRLYLTSLNATRAGEGIKVALVGKVHEETHAAAQARFETLSAQIEGFPGVAVTAKQLLPTEQSFSLEAVRSR